MGAEALEVAVFNWARSEAWTSRRSTSICMRGKRRGQLVCQCFGLTETLHQAQDPGVGAENHRRDHRRHQGGRARACPATTSRAAAGPAERGVGAQPLTLKVLPSPWSRGSRSHGSSGLVPIPVSTSRWRRLSISTSADAGTRRRRRRDRRHQGYGPLLPPRRGVRGLRRRQHDPEADGRAHAEGYDRRSDSDRRGVRNDPCGPFTWTTTRPPPSLPRCREAMMSVFHRRVLQSQPRHHDRASPSAQVIKRGRETLARFLGASIPRDPDSPRCATEKLEHRALRSGPGESRPPPRGHDRGRASRRVRGGARTWRGAVWRSRSSRWTGREISTCAALSRRSDPTTLIAAIMHANNETGVLFPVDQWRASPRKPTPRSSS